MVLVPPKDTKGVPAPIESWGPAKIKSSGERGSVLNIVFSTQNAANRRKTGKMSGIVYERERI